MGVRTTCRKLHRWLSLAVALLWVTQAASGLVLVFRWELDDMLVGGTAVPLDVPAFAASLERLIAARPHDQVVGVYTTGGVANRFDLLLEAPSGETDTLRLDGAGRLLREAPFDHDFLRAGFLRAAGTLHETLFLGDRGMTLIGISGILLAINLILAARTAWPHRARWREALRPWHSAANPPGLYQWHRALGLWLLAPLLVISLTGAATAFGEQLEAALGAAMPEPSLPLPAAAAGAAPADLAQAITIAKNRYPDAVLTTLRLPTAETPWFRIRLRQAGEVPRVYGTTSIYVDPRDGAVLLNQDSRVEPMLPFLFGAILPVHTGEAFGLPGRAIVQLLPFGFLTLMFLGLRHWWRRQRWVR